MRRRVEETLDLLGIAELRARDLRTLSGGQQQRVAIGSVLTMHPRLLVLDEPTSALDPTAAEEVLATLTRLVHDLGLTVLLAEHRLERVVPFADRMVPADRRRPAAGRRARPSVLATSPVVPPVVELGRAAGLDAAAAVGARRPAPGPRPALALPARAAPAAREPATAAAAGRGLTRGRTARRVARPRGRPRPSRAGRVTALMGRNGSGQVVAAVGAPGHAAADAGPVSRSAAPTRPASSPRPAGALVGLVPQNAADLLYLETVDEECAAADGGRAGGTAARCSTGWCPASPATGTRATSPRASGSRWCWRSCSPAGRRCVLLDEPTRGLDYAAQARARRRPARPGRRRAARCWSPPTTWSSWPQVADEVVVLAEGEVVSAGPVREVVAESPAFAPQVTKVLGPPWLRVDEVVAAWRRRP